MSDKLFVSACSWCRLYHGCSFGKMCASCSVPVDERTTLEQDHLYWANKRKKESIDTDDDIVPF